MREIARMAGVAEKAVREFIREAQAAPVVDAAPGAAEPAGELAGPDTVEAPPRVEELRRPDASVDVTAGDRVTARPQA